MSSLTEQNVSFLKLLLRSPDIGGGWRRVSDVVYPLVEKFDKRELIELKEDYDGGGTLVRLSVLGRNVVKYLM